MIGNPYMTPEWKAVRRFVLARDQHLCQLRLARCKGFASAVDHIVDWRDGGAWFDASNLQASCTACNTSKRNSRVAARARAQRDLIGDYPRSQAW